MKKHYYLVFDTETANTTLNEKGQLNSKDCLVYDFGCQVIDRDCNIYEKHSIVNKDVFFDMADLMESAYYAEKIPQYLEDIKCGKRVVKSWFEIRQLLYKLCEKYDIKAIVAHNSRFDYNACNGTQRYLTKSKYRNFFPKDIEIWDTMKMANDTICKMKSYKSWCEVNGYLTANGQVRKTAEILYRFISNDKTFIESHTGLEDVEIESIIFYECLKKHKPLRKKLFEKDFNFDDYMKNEKIFVSSCINLY